MWMTTSGLSAYMVWEWLAPSTVCLSLWKVRRADGWSDTMGTGFRQLTGGDKNSTGNQVQILAMY